MSTNYKTHTVKLSFSELGQARPHINLSKFVDKEVYVKVDQANQRGGSFSDKHLIARVKANKDDPSLYVIMGNFYCSDGRRVTSAYGGDIVEIYPTNAFYVLTAGVEPAPEPQEVTRAKEALKKLTPDQLKQLIDKITEVGE